MGALGALIGAFEVKALSAGEALQAGRMVTPKNYKGHE